MKVRTDRPIDLPTNRDSVPDCLSVRFDRLPEIGRVQSVIERQDRSEREFHGMTDERSPENFAIFYREHYSLILATVGRRLNDHSTAEDVTSEVFRVAWSQYHAGGYLTLAWLYTVARNVVGNEYRRASRSAALRAKAAVYAVDSADAADDTNADTRRAMMKLKESDRELLFMAYWEDLSGGEMAQILGCKIPTVWVRLGRARTALRAHLTVPLNDAVDTLREEGAASNG